MSTEKTTDKPHLRMVYPNEKIAELVAENARLRAVLRDIAAGEVDYVMREEWKSLADWMADRAQRALHHD